MTNAAWWRDQEQGTALAAGNISPLFANVELRQARRAASPTTRGVPTTGPMDRILASHFEPAQGANFSSECGFGGAEDPSIVRARVHGPACSPTRSTSPSRPAPAAGYGMTLLLHSLSANYNQYMRQPQPVAVRQPRDPSIVITPEARGPDQEYEGLGAADVFEVWADVARIYPLNPAYTDITGYSMGGIGTFKLGAQFPDLFARAQPTVGVETNNDVLASLRNLPVLMWNTSADELVDPATYGQTADKLSSLGYRYELDVYQPVRATTRRSAPVFPDHLELAINDQFAPAAAFLGSAHGRLQSRARHLRGRQRPRQARACGIVGDHAYWTSRV